MQGLCKAQLKSESDIISGWRNTKTLVVSIVCHAYQQEAYIEEAITSFLIQETDFAFEIIIHDDASTDNTPNIIQEFQAKYPNIIYPIIQTKNQYSLGKKPSSFTFKKANGEFIALCEGDDYWSSKFKIAEQVKAFRINPNISLCFHPAQVLDVKLNSKSVTCQHFKIDQHVSIRKVIEGRGHFMPTASLMFKNQKIDELMESFKNAPIGDYFIQVFMSSLGGAFFINKPMSIYRRNTASSWSRNLFFQKKAKIKHKLSMLKPIESFSTYFTDFKYNRYFEEVISNYCFSAIELSDGFTNKIKLSYHLYRIVMSFKSLNKFLIFYLVVRKSIIKKLGRFVKSTRDD